MANGTENRILERQLRGFLEPVIDPLRPKWGGSPTATDIPADFLPAIPAEFAHGASDEFQELLRRGLREGVDSLDPDDQRRLKAAMEQFPELAEAFQQKGEQEKQARKTPEQNFAERTEQYFAEAIPAVPGATGRAVIKTAADFLSEVSSPLIQYLEERKAATPHPVSPDRDYVEEPLTLAEENYQRLSGADKMLAWSDFIASSTTSSLLSFFTQSLDQIVNPEKHQTTTSEALGEIAGGLTDMIAQAPDQVSHIAEAIYGTRDNPVSKLTELAGTILQAPKLVLDGKDREQLRKEAVNNFYKHPEGLPFAVMIVKGVYSKATKSVRKPFDKLKEEVKPTVTKAETKPSFAKKAREELTRRREWEREIGAEKVEIKPASEAAMRAELTEQGKMAEGVGVEFFPKEDIAGMTRPELEYYTGRAKKAPAKKVIEPAKVAETPEAAAKELGIKYDGRVEIGYKKGPDGKTLKNAAGEPIIEYGYNFTILDPGRQTTLTVKTLAEVSARLKAKRAAYEAAKKTKPEPIRAGEKAGVGFKEEIVPPTEQRAVGFALPKLSDKFTRELKEARKKRGEPAGIPSMVIERAPKDVGLTTAIRTPTNLFDAVPREPTEAAYWYRDLPMKEPRYGRAAQQSSIDLAFSERDIMIEVGQRAEFLDAVLHEAKKDKKAWGKHGETFYDLVDGTIVDPSLSPASLEAVKTVRKVMTEIRDEVIRRRREQLRPGVTEIVNREWRAEKGLKGEKLTGAQRSERAAAVESALKDRVPDDWGIENYLPQMHPGDWSVWAEIDGVKTFVGAARTPSQAITRAMDHYAKHPELTPEGYRVTGRAFRGWDVLRVTQAKLWRTMGEIAKQAEDALSPQQVRDALRGVIGAKETKQKYAGFLQQRKGYEGYRKDIMGVLSAFNQNFVRWKHLTDLNKVIQPRLREIRAEGRPNAANEIEAIFTHLWGRTPSKISKLLDASIQKVPGVRDYIRPMFYERSLGRVKGAVVLTFLKINPRFNLLNRLQRYQTTLPILKGLPHTAEWRAGTKFYDSAEGHAALDQFGIKHLTGGKFLEGGRTLTKPKTREKLRSFAPETSNQEIAWSTMFVRAKRFGFSDLAANDYAFLKGNVYTQFVHLSTDVPALLRGPTMSTIMQFKRFPIKNVELGIDLIADRNYPGVAKWIGAQILLGGAKIATSPVRLVGGATAAWITAKMYQEIKEEHGEYVADLVAWGLPALVGLDMSYSFQLIDTPWGKGVPEKIGNFFMGPSGNVVYSAARSAISDKGLETSRFDRALKSVTQRVPGLKFIDALRTFAEGLDSGEYRFEDPAGRIKFKGDLRDVIVKGLGGRTLDEARIELLTEAATQINEQRDRTLNHIANTFIEKKEIDFKARDDWNELWPEFPIDEEAMMRRMIARLETKDLDRYQRMMKTLPRVFRPAFYEYDKEKMQEVLK